MKLETFFEKFELFAAAPNGLEKLRELVLDLAVTGRLVPSPGKWEMRPLKSLATKIGSGATPAGGRASYFPEGVPLIRSMNVHFRGFVRHGLAFLSDKQAEELSNVAVEADDVLLNITGASIGRVTTAPLDMAGARVNQHVAIIRTTSELLPSFLVVFLASPSVQRMIDEVQVGATRQALTKAMIEAFEVPTPTLEEQKWIVAKVGELMALCDRLESQRQERVMRHSTLAQASLARFAEAPTPANLKLLFHDSYAIEPVDLRKSILALAVQGQLVHQDPAERPARALLEAISRSRRQLMGDKKIRDGKVSRPQTAAAPPERLPAGWEWTNVASLCFKVTDGTHFTPRYVESGVRFVSAKDIAGGRLVFDRCRYISEEEHERLFRRCNPEFGDIVISKSGSIGTVAIVEDRGEFSLFESLALLKFDQTSLNSRYLVLALSHACSRLTTGHIRGVGVKHLHLDILRGLELALPPLPEQQRIVTRVDQLMLLVGRLEAQLASSHVAAERLTEAMVAELTSLG